MRAAQKSFYGFSYGNTLLQIAGMYPTLHDSVLELVQNSIDADADNINISLDYHRRSCVYSDDGNGTTREKFEESLRRICLSVKDADKMGRYGMGNVSPVGKCDIYTFTSTPKENPRGYHCWTFDTEEIRQHRETGSIPVAVVSDLRFDRTGKTKGGIPWRTLIKMKGLIKDRTITRVNIITLKEAILDRYGAKMKQIGTIVTIRITETNKKTVLEKFRAEEYEGKKLPLKYYRNTDVGQTVMQLYLANKIAGNHKGKVVIGEIGNPFRIPFQQFARYASEYLGPETIKDLNSGIFEGEILGEKIIIAPSRKHFLLNDALVGFCIVIEEWHKKVGAAYVAEIREEAQDERYQRLGLRSLRFIEELLNHGEFSHLRDVVKSFSQGTIGTNHFEKRVQGLQPHGSVSIQGEDGKEKKGGEIKTFSPPQTEHLGHTPLTSAGPQGKRRAVVKGNSIGLQYVFADMQRDGKLWELDKVAGTLTFNTRNTTWHQCEVDEKVLMRFQEIITIEALTLETVPEELKERHRRLADEKLTVVAFWLLKGDEATGRKPGSSLKLYRARKKT